MSKISVIAKLTAVDGKGADRRGETTVLCGDARLKGLDVGASLDEARGDLDVGGRPDVGQHLAVDGEGAPRRFAEKDGEPLVGEVDLSFRQREKGALTCDSLALLVNVDRRVQPGVGSSAIFVSESQLLVHAGGVLSGLL